VVAVLQMRKLVKDVLAQRKEGGRRGVVVLIGDPKSPNVLRKGSV
jgi:hypothetical protein